MADERSAASVRATIALQGSGRLAGVSQVLKVKLEPKSIEWEPVDERTLAVRGEIHSYMYFLRAGSREIQGEGLAIPFSRTIDAPGLAGEAIEVEVEDLSSEYDYDPVTTDFQHRITVVLGLRRKEPRPSLAASPRPGADGPRDLTPVEAEAERALPPASGTPVGGPEEAGGSPASPPEAPGSAPSPATYGSAAGETRISQVRTGPSPLADPVDQVVEALPTIDEPPLTRDEGHRPAGARGQVERQGKNEAGAEATSGAQSEESEGLREAPGRTLVWKPFPPPIDS